MRGAKWTVTSLFCGGGGNGYFLKNASAVVGLGASVSMMVADFVEIATANLLLLLHLLRVGTLGVTVAAVVI